MEYLFNELYKYSKNPRYPFHMPGHKLGNLCSFSDIHKMDITEIDNFDNLHDACGIIKNSQIRASEIFNSDETYFIINGSTTGNICAILSVCSDGDKIAISRNSHKSAFSGIILSNAKACYIMPEFINKLNIMGQVSPNSVEDTLKKNKDVKAVFITSPTYEGFTADVEGIANIVHKYNAILIVDEAHGAHFNFNNYFPKSSINCGADIVIQSIHKTLPALTQTALLHIKYKNIIDNNYKYKIKSLLSMLQTSSPSYVLMASIDKCCEFLRYRGNEYFTNYINLLKLYRNKFKNFKNLKLINDSYKYKNGIHDIDNSKFVFFFNSNIMSANEINNILINKYNIQIEYYSENYIIIMTSIANTESEFSKLYTALYDIDSTIDFNGFKNSDKNIFDIDIIQSLCMREAYFSEKENINIHKSENKICGDFIIPYPPGIPILCPGEKITAKSINYIDKLLKSNINILGIDFENNLKILKY